MLSSSAPTILPWRSGLRLVTGTFGDRLKLGGKKRVRECWLVRVLACTLSHRGASHTKTEMDIIVSRHTNA